MCYTREIPPVEPRKGSYFLKKNLTYLTRWPQPAAILLVKICKNPVFGVAKLQEPNLVPTHRDRRHRAKIEPLTHRDRRHRAKIEPITHRDRRHRAKIGPKVEKLVWGIE